VGWLEEALKLAGARDKRLQLPAESRNPGRLAERLRPEPGRRGYWIIVCRGLACRLCGFPEEPRVRVERALAGDELSGLRHRLPRIVVECCGRVIARGEWRGSRIVVEDYWCPVEAGPRGWRCLGAPCGGPLECLEACAIRGL